MGLESLLLSRDPEVIRVLRPTLEKLSIDVEVCRGARSGSEILSSEKFDAVIVDCDDLQGGLEVLEKLRRGTSNRNSVAFAILNGNTTTHKAFELGANFVLQKPISALNAMRCFGAALGFMARERRRYFRHPVEIPVTVAFGQGHELKATTTNLSEGGMAIRFRGTPPKGAASKVVFTLPGAQGTMEPKADFAWMDGAGRAGIRFVEMPQTSREYLDNWLADQLEDVEQRSREQLEQWMAEQGKSERPK
jgi:CheY-like chemotaxis protein